ncbi:MAG: hypothetical protein ACRDP3_06245 [Streptomyces sp.]|uniref:hypothetical protein n=1 Tax=Streptomyces sp. TaxID=1931 RepID=UPI003D6C1C8D
MSPTTPNDDHGTWSASAIAAEVNAGRLSAREVTTAALSRIARDDPGISGPSSNCGRCSRASGQRRLTSG